MRGGCSEDGCSEGGVVRVGVGGHSESRMDVVRGGRSEEWT